MTSDEGREASAGFRKPELLIGAGSIEQIERFADAGADAVGIGDRRFGMRLMGHIPEERIAEAIRAAHSKGMKAYVVCNGILHNELLPALPGYLKRIADAGADAVVFGDPAVLISMRQAGVKLPLHWNAEMTSTNYKTAGYWVSKGATRVFLARELNMDEVLEFRRQFAAEIQVQVHGMTNIYHSKRNLLTNYWEHQGRPASGERLDADRKLFLIEEERKDEKYPVYEDESGTHIMSGDDLCMLESLHELMEAGFDSFRIEGLLKSPEYNEAVLRAYRLAIDAYAADPAGYSFDEAWLEPIRSLQDPDRELSFGFFYKEQVY
ncbi:peptidase U32 family protein [Paenibacillus ginsengarvi]|uniref:U32 family peptidase n=1 Tax=Paenibacillus ginsengarvi TaxID=400777 RepID=A0A3B0C3P9_9BACL|nr:peptidase U32 family protein [Paenibacillus ginsengarvi]RKN80442.1 U32 family peptidase [Paenibacillus ginsengarvi]